MRRRSSLWATTSADPSGERSQFVKGGPILDPQHFVAAAGLGVEVEKEVAKLVRRALTHQASVAHGIAPNARVDTGFEEGLRGSACRGHPHELGEVPEEYGVAVSVKLQKVLSSDLLGYELRPTAVEYGTEKTEGSGPRRLEKKRATVRAPAERRVLTPHQQ